MNVCQAPVSMVSASMRKTDGDVTAMELVTMVTHVSQVSIVCFQKFSNM